jgi:hypothetical protein
MRSVTFSFRPEIPEEKRDEVLEAIARWSAVASASLLKPDAKNELTKLMAYAHLEEDADIDAIVRKIASLPEVDNASMPPPRKLA